MLCAYLVIAGFVAAVCFAAWRMSLPWDERGKPWFPFLQRAPKEEREPVRREQLSGWQRLHPKIAIEGRFDGWSAEPRRTEARFVVKNGALTTERLATPIDEGALAFLSPGGTPLIAEPLPDETSDGDFDEERRVPSAHELIRFYVGQGGLLIITSPRGALVIATSLSAKDVGKLLASLRLVGEAEPAEHLRDRVELRVCNDTLLADVLEQHPARKLAFEILAPGLNVLFVDKPHPHSTLMTPLDHEGLSQAGGKDAFLARMAKFVDPLAEPLDELGNDMLTNQRGTEHAASLVTHARFFERFAPRFGDAMLVGVPSVSRVFVSRDTPKHREVLAAMLDASTKVETTTRLSTRVYRVTGAEWDEWSVVDEKN
ncbi:MAG: hypothetical protein QM817_08775 [Archangium sp.]